MMDYDSFLVAVFVRFGGIGTRQYGGEVDQVCHQVLSIMSLIADIWPSFWEKQSLSLLWISVYRLSVRLAKFAVVKAVSASASCLPAVSYA